MSNPDSYPLLFSKRQDHVCRSTLSLPSHAAVYLSESLEGVVFERAELVVGEVEEVEPAQLGEAAPLHHRDLVPAQLEVREGGVGAEDALHRADPACEVEQEKEISFFMTMTAATAANRRQKRKVFRPIVTATVSSVLLRGPS